MSQPLNSEKVLSYIKRSGALITESEKRAAAEAKRNEAVNSQIPEVVEALIQNNRIPEALREKAAAALKDHTKALEILASVAAHRTDAEVGHLGKGVKSAAAKSRYGKDSPYVGAVSTEERESDRVLSERLGLS